MAAIRNVTHLMMSFCVVLLIVPSTYGQESSRVTKKGREIISWSDFDGQVVIVDGLAWGTFGKGLGRHLILTSGYKVYLHGDDFDQASLDGCLLRVCGVLQKKRMEKAPPGAQGYGEAFDYYTIDIVSSERIDRVEKDQMLPSPGDWIKPGMTSKAASDLITSYGFPEFDSGFPLLRDGSTPKAFQTSKNELIIIYESKGKVRTVAKVPMNELIQGKPEQEQLAAFLLPPRDTTDK